MKYLLILLTLFYLHPADAQTAWRQSLHYTFHVAFHPQEKSLDVQMELKYANHSPDTLTFIWFQVWPNAFRNDRTALTDQLLENGDTRFYFSDKDQKGYLNRLEFHVKGEPASTTVHLQHLDIVKLRLPKPLVPGAEVAITAGFHVRLPFNFNGYGYSPHHAELRNWYPEPAVYDTGGWHPMPFLVQGGAYHEAADYEVEIEAPRAYRIAAGAAADTLRKDTGTITCLFRLQQANAFAWVADNRFIVKKKEIMLNPERSMALQYFYLPGKRPDADVAFRLAESQIKNLSERLMPYPNSNLTLVQGGGMHDQNFSGLVMLESRSPKSWQSELKKGINAQWFQTILLTNQRDQPWLSKGFIQFYDLYPDKTERDGRFSQTHGWLRVAEKNKTTQPITTAAPVFTRENDSLIAADKAAVWIGQVQNRLSGDFDAGMQAYFRQWHNGHPYPQDLLRQLRTDSLQSLEEKLSNNQPLFGPQKRILKPAFIFSAKHTDRYNYIGLAPVAGYNRYDGFMLGLLAHNINLPANNFEFLLSPLYAFGSKTVEGLGRLSYTWRPDGSIKKITIGLNGARFDMNKATDSTGKTIYESFSKLVPYVRLDLRPRNPRSSISRWIEWSSYLINENSFGDYTGSPDSVLNPNTVTKSFRYVNELSFTLRDSRTLYPYGVRIELQQSKLFYRANLHADYFLNYPDGGGLQLRFIAAKFGVWNQRNAGYVARYEPKLTGVTGDEDYLYSDYFIGRSATYAVQGSSISNSGIAAQQIMNRDGGLKLRLDAYNYLEGRSSNWVSSLNFNTSLPANLFPFPLPIRIFFDVGTYAEAWQDNALTSKFLYTGGLQLSLFKNVLNIYAPLLYSSDFKDAFAGISFGKKITFSIDIQHIPYQKMIRKMADHD